MKRIAISCDGTWNTPDQMDGNRPAPTNVVKLHNAIAGKDEAGIVQLKYYHPGVGTDPGWWSKLAGGGLGIGIDRNIMSAYRFLADKFEPGDAVYLFGFSRGAYTVRSLAGMIARCGILDTSGLTEKETWSRIESIYRKGYRRGTPHRRAGWGFRSEPQKTEIRFLGVWDTVGALGIPDDMALLNLLDRFKDYTFHDTELSAMVLAARHAMAIDERRASFQPTLWTKIEVDRDVKQLWFPGVHSDVGGGYAECGLSDGALEWMVGEARGTGLRFNDGLLAQLAPSHHGVLHDSLRDVFAFLPTQPRSVPCLSRQARLHASSISRFSDPPIAQAPYRPTAILGPGEEATVDVFAVEPWNETGLFLEEGVDYELEASGEWLDSSIPCGPGGTRDGKPHLGEIAHVVGSMMGRVEESFRRLRGNESADFLITPRHDRWPWFCLVGAIANGAGASTAGLSHPHEVEKIGTGRPWTPKKSGYLYTYANDAWRFYFNNSGHVRLTVRRA